MTLLIGQAWDETKAVFRADGKAIVAVALALTVLPGAILETAAPSNLRPADAPLWLSLLGFLSALLGITSQIAISRIALGPSTTVGSALALGFRRVLPLFGALILVVLPFVLLIALLGFSQGGQFTPQSIPPVLALPITAIMLVLLVVLIRLMFMTPLAAETGLGSIGLIKNAWRLSRGRVLKLFLLILLLLMVALLLIGALGGAGAGGAVEHQRVASGAGPAGAGGARLHAVRGDGEPPLRAGQGRYGGLCLGPARRARLGAADQLHFAKGGRLIRIASTLPLVLRPKIVPRS